MRLKFLLRLIVLGAVCAVFAQSKAQTIMYDGAVLDGAPYANSNGVFITINASNPAGHNGGSGFSGGWLRWDANTTGNTNRIRTELPGLSYADGFGKVLQTIGGAFHNFARLATPPANTDAIQNQQFWRQLWTPGPAAGDTVFFSFLADVIGNAQINLSFNAGTVTNNVNTPSVAFGNSAANTITVTMQDTMGTNFVADTGVGWVAAGSAKLFVGRIQNYGQPSQRLDFWLNPANLASITSEAPTTTLLSSNGVAGRTFSWWRHSGGATQNGYCDEFRIAYGAGASFATVLPLAAVPYKVRVETAADGSGSVVGDRSFTAGESLTVYAIGRTDNNAFVANVPAVWTMEGESGNVADSDLVASPNGRSAVFTAHGAGSGLIYATAPVSGFVEASGTITVVGGSASQVRVETAADGLGTLVPAQQLASGNSLVMYAVARDSGGNYVSNAVATWSAVNKTDGIADGDLIADASGTFATLTGSLAGSATLRASVPGLSSVDSGLVTLVLDAVWAGDGVANRWDFTSLNWATNGIGGVVFRNAQDANFDDTGSTLPAITLTNVVIPRVTVFSNSTATYTLVGSGKISGTGGLTHWGSGRVILGTDNDYAGETLAQVAGGIIQIGNGGTNGTLGQGRARLNNGSAIHFNRTDLIENPYVVNREISGNADFQLVVNSGAVKLTGTVENNGALGVVKSNATLMLAGPTGNRALGRFTTGGAYSMTIEPGGLVQLGGPGTGQDQISTEGLRNNLINGTFDLKGSSETIGGLEGVGVIDNTGTNNSVLTAGNGVNDGSTRIFAGVLRNSGAATLGFTAEGTNSLILDGSNTASGPFRVQNGCMLGGTGVISGPLTVAALGILDPGSPMLGPIGTLAVSNSLTLQGTNIMHIDRGTSPNSDRIVGLTGITYGGTLSVQIAGAPPELGDSYQLYSFTGAASGSFAAMELPTLDAGRVWYFNPATGVLSVSTPRPPDTAITNTVIGGNLILSWPNNEGWKLQCQTNTLAVGLSSNWTTLTGVTSPYTNAVNPATGSVFYRLIFP